MEKTLENFEIESYVRDSPPLTADEFAIMMSYDNHEISIDDLDFSKVRFNILDYIVA